MIETRLVPVADTTLAVHLCGRGPLCVLVHGYPLDARMWTDVLQSDVAHARRLCAIDLRGHGNSPWAGDEVHAMERFADDVAAVIRTLGDDGLVDAPRTGQARADVVALSMGGYAALALAERSPELLRSLVLVDTRAGADSEEGRNGRRTAMQNVVQHGRRWLGEQMLPKLLAPDADLRVRARLQTMIEATPVESILADLEGMIARPDRHEALRNLRCPALVVVGEQDALTPPAEAQRMAEALGGARCAIVPGAGHMTPMERPAEFAALLREFFAGHTQA